MATAFRAADHADLEAILAHERRYYAAEGYQFDPAAAHAALEGLLADAERGRLWVAADGDTVVGYLAVTFGWSLEYRGRDAFVDELYLAEAYRGRGLGREAIGLAEGACREAGVRTLHLEVERENAVARVLYQRAGFSSHERILMSKPLTPLR